MKFVIYSKQDMKDKVVLITGASSGIGEALARKYAAEGSKLVLAARRMDRLKALQDELVNNDVLIIETDVTVEEDCKRLVELAILRYGQIDVLVNNAGISMRAVFEELDLQVIRRLMDVNFWGTVYCTKYALPHLLKVHGSVVGVISIAGHVGLPGRIGYSASKFAVRGFLDTLRIENLKKGLHVLVAAPGFTASEVRLSALNASGRQQGETPRDESKMMSAETCAGHIYRAVVKRKRQLVLTSQGKLSVLLGFLLPSFFDKMAYNVMSKEPDSPLK